MNRLPVGPRVRRSGVIQGWAMRRGAVAGLMLFLLSGPSAPASAQLFLDAYGGMPFTRTADMTVERGGGAERATRPVTYNTESYVVGGRIGMWFDWVGVAGDASYFRLDGDAANVSVVSTSLLFMLRLRLLRDETVRNGRLQPYLGAGPGYFLTVSNADFRPDVSETVKVFSGSDIGLDARAGLAWEFTRGVALFAEYRLSWFRLSAEDQAASGGAGSELIESSLWTHHAIGGLSLRF